jgi:GntR family transcriptional regulator / MocR family aminotransferase
VVHIGSFSKTISPALRLGFMVVPPELSSRFAELAACLAPAPAAGMQRAVAKFLRDGHYLRHLRRMKRLYAARRESLLRCLGEMAPKSTKVQATPGLAVLMLLPKSASDVDIASRALEFGLAPRPMSAWYMQPPPQQGLLLCVTNLNERRLPADCRRLLEIGAIAVLEARQLRTVGPSGVVDAVIKGNAQLRIRLYKSVEREVAVTPTWVRQDPRHR